MGIHEATSPASELETSTENAVHDFVATINPLDIEMDNIIGTNIEGVDGIYVFYALGGILVILIIFVFFYSYFLHIRHVEQEMELPELSDTGSLTSCRFQINDRRAVTGEFYETENQILSMPTLAQGSSEGICIIDLPEIPLRNPQEILERKYLPSVRANTREGAHSSNVPRMSETPDHVLESQSEISERFQCVSVPEESHEILSPEDFLCPHTKQMPKDESANENKLGTDATSTAQGQTQPTAEGKSRSSPTSPSHPVRRRLIKSESNPQRPTSWQ